jgi:hypothetical protein
LNNADAKSTKSRADNVCAGSTFGIDRAAYPQDHAQRCPALRIVVGFDIVA